jgi:hypothetical protein
VSLSFAQGRGACDFLNRGVDPARRGFGVAEDAPSERRIELPADLRNGFGRNAAFAECLQRLHDESALRQFESSLFERRVPEGEPRAANQVGAGRAIGEVDRACGNLGRETEQVLGGGSVGLDAPGEFARDRVRDLIEIGTEGTSEPLALAWVIVDAANDSSDDAVALPAMQRGIDGGTGAEIGEVGLGEGPTPLVAVDAGNYQPLNGFEGGGAGGQARKNSTFFLQELLEGCRDFRAILFGLLQDERLIQRQDAAVADYEFAVDHDVADVSRFQRVDHLGHGVVQGDSVRTV